MSDSQAVPVSPEPVPVRSSRLPADPVAAFGELLVNSVPELCDACWVELDVDGRPRQRIEMPSATSPDDRRPDNGAGPPLRSVPDTSANRGQHDVPFTGDATPTAPGYAGVASFHWWSRVPTSSDGVVVNLLVELTVRTVAWQRSLHAVDASTVQVERLEVALHTNRRIGAAVGIVMSTRKLTQEQAFEQLAAESQRRNRKLHQIAEEVLETGWLDLAVSTAADDSNRSGHGFQVQADR